MQHKKSKPFPPILFNVGSIAIEPLPLEGTNTDPTKGPCTVVNSRYSEDYVSPLEPLVAGSLGSLFANSRIDDPAQRKTRCDDAFAVHLTEDYPYLLIADGGFGSCKPEHIPQITNDPKIKAAILKFKSEVALTSEDSAKVKELSQALIKTITDICDEKGRYTFEARREKDMASQFTMSLAIPFVTPRGASKVISFGIGGDEIYKINKEQQVKPLRKANHKTSKVLMPPVVDLMSHDFERPIREYNNAVKELAITLEDFEEDDFLFATTDGVDKILFQYNSHLRRTKEESKSEDFKPITIEELTQLPPKALSEKLKNLYDATLQMASDNYNKYNAEHRALKQQLTPLSQEYDRIQQAKLPGEEKDTERQLAITEEQKSIHTKMQRLPKIDFWFGDDYAFCKMRLTKNPWPLVATPEVLLDIIKDEEYWKTKTIWKKSVPTGIGQMQHTLTTPEHSLREAVHTPIEKLMLLSLTANARHYNYWTYWVSSRQHETQYLYNLVSKPKESYADNEEFQYLYTDWVKHNGPERAAKKKHETAPKVAAPSAALSR